MSDPYAQQRLRALAWEARRRGISYGILCTQLQAGEDEEILRRFAREVGARLPAEKGPPVNPRALNWEEARELYSQGLTDREIADRLERKATSVASWRIRMGLPPNRRKKGG